MSNGRTTQLSKDDIALITGDDMHFDMKLVRKLKRYGWEKVYNQIRFKEEV